MSLLIKDVFHSLSTMAMSEEQHKPKNSNLPKVFIINYPNYLGRWPEKSVKVFIGLLQNVESNAAVKGLDVDKLVLTHIAVN